MREEGNFSGEAGSEAPMAEKLEARSTGVRGETYAYWYLRRHGYVFVGKNYMPRGIIRMPSVRSSIGKTKN